MRGVRGISSTLLVLSLDYRSVWWSSDVKHWNRFQTTLIHNHSRTQIEQLVYGGQMEVMQRADVQMLSSTGCRRTDFSLQCERWRSNGMCHFLPFCTCAPVFIHERLNDPEVLAWPWLHHRSHLICNADFFFLTGYSQVFTGWRKQCEKWRLICILVNFIYSVVINSIMRRWVCARGLLGKEQY